MEAIEEAMTVTAGTLTPPTETDPPKPNGGVPGIAAVEAVIPPAEVEAGVRALQEARARGLPRYDPTLELLHRGGLPEREEMPPEVAEDETGRSQVRWHLQQDKELLPPWIVGALERTLGDP